MAVADFSRINSNIGALNALNSLNNVNGKLGMHQMRLATGRRINSAADDPAGLTIATKFRSRNENMKTAMGNIGDAKNLLSVAEGGLSKIQDILVDMRSKVEAAASDTLGADERSAIQTQLNTFAEEINQIVETTQWNDTALLGGLTGGSALTFQTGPENSTNDRVSLTLEAARTTDLGIGANAVTVGDVANFTDDTTGFVIGNFTSAEGNINSLSSELNSGTYKVGITVTDADTATLQLFDSNNQLMNIDTGSGIGTSITFDPGDAGNSFDLGNGLRIDVADTLAVVAGTATFEVSYSRVGAYNDSVTSASTAQTAMDNLDTAISRISDRLQNVGTVSSRLSFKEETLAEAQINTEAAYSRIMNADMAMNQLEATKYQILQQTATSMLAQANQAPQGLLSLFR